MDITRGFYPRIMGSNPIAPTDMCVAQSGRATVSKTVGWGFDSLRTC